MNSEINSKINSEINRPVVYITATAAYLALMVAAVIYGNHAGAVQQTNILVNIAMGAGFLVYLKIYEYDVSFAMRIYDKKCLYIVYFLIFVMLIGSYHLIDMPFSENVSANLWCLTDALAAAIAIETVCRALAGYCFPRPGVKAEALIILCGGATSLYQCAYSLQQGIMAFAISIGIAAMMTGLYFRYRKLGANMATNFILYYLVNVTAVNSSTGTAVLGRMSIIVVGLAALGMLAYGCAMLKAYNESGIYDDRDAIEKQNEQNEQFKEAFAKSKEKYAEKVNEKTAPTIAARREKYKEKQQAKEEKRKEKNREANKTKENKKVTKAKKR